MKTSLSFISVLFSVLSIENVIGHDFKFCGKDVLGIKTVTLSPDPVKAGGKLNVEIGGYINIYLI